MADTANPTPNPTAAQVAATIAATGTATTTAAVAAASASASPSPAASAAPAAAKPAARPAPPDKNVASPNAPRPSVVYSGIASVPDVVASIHHKVEPGESLASLARDFYGDRKKADKIRAANPTLAPGQEPAPGTVVKIPKG